MRLTIRLRPALSVAACLLLGFGTGALGSLHSPRAFAAEDDYTRAIRSEGSKLDVQDRSSSAAAPATTRTVADFEMLLRNEAPASLRFYNELDPALRQQVYEYFLKEGKVTDGVKRFIVKLRLGA